MSVEVDKELLDMYGITEQEAEASVSANLGEWETPPKNTRCLAEVVKSEAKLSESSGRPMVKNEYKVIAWESKATGNYGRPRIWDNGRMLVLPPPPVSMVGQPEEAIKKRNDNVMLFSRRLGAHGLTSKDINALEFDVAKINTDAFVGRRVIIRLGEPERAGDTYTDKAGETVERKNTRLNIADFEPIDRAEKYGIDVTPF